MSERAVVQKALTPAMSDAIFRSSYERIAGYVVPADDVNGVAGIPDLLSLHGLRFPGSPFHDELSQVDVLRFPSGSNLNAQRALGGTSAEEAQRNGGTFVEHPPFNGTGFAALDRPAVPVYWVPTHRPPVGTELWRYEVSGSSRFLARYGGVAVGWTFRQDLEARRPAHGRDLSRFTGGLARIAGEVFLADLVEDGVDVVASGSDVAPFLSPSDNGLHVAHLALDAIEEYFELDVRANFNGIDFRVTGQRHDTRSGAVLEATSLTHNVQILEALGLTKIDAGVYEADLPHELLDTAHTEQVQLPGWPGTTRQPS
ncbi:hypothetical protein GA0004736_0314 [Curtobacterium sp. 9128]|uniref:hypothetical protein n=1 Tax=Curtobacterium sp. 9128 TaxID=1793722 RepID=UPI0007D72274|nr:hypothetical protein [Curtobacterium sp. 9128]SBN61427.1 hypothetical protein GA0004736_0314 [Curtobacterium sp. 9128]